MVFLKRVARSATAAIIATFLLVPVPQTTASAATWSLDGNFTDGIFQLISTDTTAQNAVIYVTPIATYNGSIYACYRDADFDTVVAKSTDGGGTWATTTIAAGSTNDGHNTCSIGIDANGYIHVAYDHHAVPLRYKISDAPESIASFSNGTMTGTAETSVTYPLFFRSPSGVLYFLYRDGASGDGNLHMRIYSADSGTWSNAGAPLVDGVSATPSVNPYWGNLVWDSNGDIHFSWNWRETSAPNTNHNLLYAKYDTSDGQWEKTDGTAYTLPIDKAQAEVASVIGQNAGLTNQNANWVDSRGYLHIAYVKNAPDGKSEIFHTAYNGSTWVTTQATDLNPVGTDIWNLARPQIIIDSNDVTYIFFTDSGKANSVDFTLPASDAFYMIKSEDYGATWTSPLEIDEFPKGGEFNIDYDYFRSTGDIRFLYQEIADYLPSIYILEGQRVVDENIWSASTNIDANAAITGTLQLSCTPGTANNLIAQWKFEETTGEVINTSATTTKLNGAISGNILRGQTGQHGNAIYLNGSSYVTVLNDNPLDFGSTRDFTVQAWVNATSTPTGSVIVGKYNGGVAPGFIIDMQSGGRVRALIRDGSGSGTAEVVSVTSSVNILDGNWHHVAATFDRGGNLSLYIDGGNASTTSISTVTGSISNAWPLNIGTRNSTSTSNFFLGYIDEVSITNGIVDVADFSYDEEYASQCPFDDATFTTPYHTWSGQVIYSSLLVDSSLNSGTLSATVQTSSDAFSTVESFQTFSLSSGSNSYPLNLSGNGKYSRVQFSFDPSAVQSPMINAFTLFADVDTTPPVITLNGSATIELELGATYTELGASASDDIDDSVDVTITGTIDTSVAGTYEIAYDAEDDSGNAAIRVIRTIVVAGSAQRMTAWGWTPPATVVQPITPSTSVSAPTIATTLRRGMKNAEVSLLQTLLSTDITLYPERLVTGFFGLLTERAVQRFQSKFGIVSAGTPDSTGYGLVGPQTRRKLSEIFSQSVATSSTSVATTTSFRFSRELSLLDEGEDVRKLQEFLNAHGFTVAEAGPGSSSNETTRFGAATRAAVMRFQAAYAAEILTPGGFAAPTGMFGPASIKKANELLARDQ